jgi:hypothetical protein
LIDPKKLTNRRIPKAINVLMFTSWSFPCNIYAKAGSFFTRVDSTISILPVVHANPFQTSVFRRFLSSEKNVDKCECMGCPGGRSGKK